MQTLRSPLRRVQHLRRYQEIARILVKYGFGELVDRLDMRSYLSLPRRLLRREPALHQSLPERVRMAVEELGPTFVKFGQIMSTRPDVVPPELIAELSKLRDTVPAVPWEQIRTRIETELGPIEGLFAEIDPQPIAAASLGQVHTAVLPSGKDVVIKVQRPGIQHTVGVDLEILFDLARLLQERSPLGEIYDLTAIAEDFGYTLQAEMDYRREGRNADRFRHNFADESYVHIPRVHWPLTTHSVLVMERIDGIKIDDLQALDRAGYDRRRIAAHAAQLIIKEILQDGFFHADPHPGNFAILPGEVIGAMDFGLVGHLDPRDKTMIIQLYVAAVQIDIENAVSLLSQMGVAGSQVDRPRLQRDIGRLLHRYQGLALKEIGAAEVLDEVMQIAFRHRLKLPSDLWLLGKTLAMMEGIGHNLDPDFDIFAVSEPIVRRLTRDMLLPNWWAGRLLKTTGQWAHLLASSPASIERLLTLAEEGEMRLVVEHDGLAKPLAQLDHITTRLALSILVAAFIIGLALFVPALSSNQTGGWGLALALLAFMAAGLLGIWLLFSILRSGKK